MKMKQRQGVALIWVVILSAVLIITATTMANYIVKESRFSVRTEESTRVYAAAKSGIEWGKLKIGESGSVNGTYDFDLLDSDGTNDTIVTIDKGSRLITSTSTYQGVTRKLKYIINEKKGKMADFGSIASDANPNNMWLGGNSESFDLQFDYWGTNPQFSFGVIDVSNNDKIYMESSAGGSVRLVADDNGTIVNSSTFAAPATSSTDYYAYRAKIKYIKNTSAKITIEYTNPITRATSCTGSSVIDLTGRDFGNLARLYITSPVATPRYKKTGSIMDGTYITINDQEFIDNIYGSFITDAPLRTVTVSASPAGSGSVAVSPAAGPYPDGSEVTLTAGDGLGYQFSNWSGASCPIAGSTNRGPNSFFILGNVNCTANFVTTTTYSLTVTKSGDGSGTITATAPTSTDNINCGADCVGTYNQGTSVILGATPSSHSVIREWSGGGCSGNGPTCTVSMNAAKSVNVRFARILFDFNTGILSDYYTTIQVGGGIDLLAGGANWAPPEGSGRSLFLNGVYAGPCTVGWQDPNDAYITKLIYVPPTATYLSFQAAGGVTGNPNNSYNDTIMAGVLNSAFTTWITQWSANSNGTNTLISGHTSTPPGYNGWNTYTTNVSAYRGQDVYFYVRAHVGCWWSAAIVDNIRVY